jgi:hypothetical protein
VLTIRTILKRDGEYLAITRQHHRPIPLSAASIETMRTIMSAPEGENLSHLNCGPLQVFDLLARRPGQPLSLSTTGALVLGVIIQLQSRGAGSCIDLPGLGHHERALHARVALARSRVLSSVRELQVASEFAYEAGHAAHPDQIPSPYIAHEPALLGFWKEGWARRAWETRPLTEEDLLETIKKMDVQALQGTGQFYELYEQKFTGIVEVWLPTLRDNERAVALRLLRDFCYAPQAKGHWVYDAEENDIHLVGGEDESEGGLESDDSAAAKPVLAR